MHHEWTLARAFVGLGGHGRLHSSFAVSILGVLIGVAFLVLTLGVYDSYAAKLEAIAFSVYPHVLVLDAESSGPGARPAEDGVASASSSERCVRICRGDVVLNPEVWTSEQAGLRVPVARLKTLRQLLGEAGAAGVSAPVILEEGDLGLELGPAQGGEAVRPVVAATARPIRVLGIDPAAPTPVPRVDLVLDQSQMDLLREEPETVFLSASLWRETVDAGGAPLGVVRLGRPGERPAEYSLGGPFELGFHALAHNLLITSVESAQRLLGLGDSASYLGLTLANPYRSRPFVAALEQPLEAAGFTATDWTRIAGGDFESLRLFRRILFLVLGLSFLITAFGIRNALAILTLERRRQIGVLRALGLRDRSIRVIFLLIACGIGLVGTLPGLVVGSLASLRFGHWLDAELAGVLPIRGVEMAWQPAALAQVMALVLLVCAATSAVAVSRALQLDPVRCLQEE